MSQSIINKLLDVAIVENEFKGEDGNLVKYKSLILTVTRDGEEIEVEAKLAKSEGRSGYILLTTADDK